MTAWHDVVSKPLPRDETWFVVIDHAHKRSVIARWDNDHDGYITTTDELLCLDGPDSIHLHYAIWSHLPDRQDRSNR